VAPSPALRTWFGHDPARWSEFRRRYLRELAATDAGDELLALAEHPPLTLLFAAKDLEHNNAIVLRQWLTARRTSAKGKKKKLDPGQGHVPHRG
jgi:uncharacterized protein YeaO (DUF488 family)